MTTTLFLALITTIVGQLMADELKAWSGWLHKEMRRRAVRRLPLECRERYDEEWESGLDETPGEIFKLIYSLGLLKAAFGIYKVALEGSVHSRTFSSMLKRAIDMVFSILVLIMFLPVMLILAIAIKVESPGPVFYTSKRVDRKGRTFRCIKFRTMTINRDLPHITQLGRFLRRNSLDELPQFFNVLRGDMSIVGPRPPISK
jgi:hypothetical protein